MTDDRPYHHGDLRAALLAAAEIELALKGVEGFSLRAVAKRAGVSHAAPAHHFGDVTGLLTALAAEGFRTFLATQLAREAGATGAAERLIADALGYVDFARDRPALFRLIFSSVRPNFSDPALATAAEAAFVHLVNLVKELGGSRTDVHAVWATAHGMADLMASGRLRGLDKLTDAERTATLRAIFARVLPGQTAKG